MCIRDRIWNEFSICFYRHAVPPELKAIIFQIGGIQFPSHFLMVPFRNLRLLSSKLVIGYWVFNSFSLPYSLFLLPYSYALPSHLTLNTYASKYSSVFTLRFIVHPVQIQIQ